MCTDPSRKKNYPSDVIRTLTMVVKVIVGDKIYELWKKAILDRIPEASASLDTYRDLAEEACAKYYAIVLSDPAQILSDPDKFIEQIIPETPNFRFINLDTVATIARNVLDSVKSDFVGKDIVELSWDLYTNLFLLAETVKLLKGTEYEEDLRKEGLFAEDLLKPCSEDMLLYDCVQDLTQRAVRVSTKLLVLANLKV